MSNYNYQPVYGTSANNQPCPVPSQHFVPQTQNCPVPVQQLVKVPQDKSPYILSARFEDDALKGLSGSVLVDPACKTNELVIKGAITGFANLSNIRVLNTSTTLTTSAATVLPQGNSEFQLSVAVPFKVNGIRAAFPTTTTTANSGWNFRTAVGAEVAENFLPVQFTAGVGATAGDIFATVDANNLTLTNATIPLSVTAINANAVRTNITYTSNESLEFVSASSAISVNGNDATNQVSIALNIDSATGYNDLSLATTGTRGLLSYHIPRFVDTNVNTNINILDTTSPFTLLPIGSVALWQNNTLPLPIFVRKTDNTGSSQWSLLNFSISTANTSTATLNLSNASVLTANFPLRVSTNLVAPAALSLPMTAGSGYVLNGADGITITDSGNGIARIGLNAASLFNFTDTSTIDATVVGSTVSFVNRLRVEGATVPVPAGPTAVGYNLSKATNSLIVLNTGTGEVQFGDNLVFQNTNSISFTRTNSPSATTVSASVRKGYNTCKLNATVSGTIDVVSTGADCIYLNPATALTGDVNIILNPIGALEGDLVAISALDVETADLASFDYIVTSTAGFFANPANAKTLSANANYNFIFTEVAPSTLEWRHLN